MNRNNEASLVPALGQVHYIVGEDIEKQETQIFLF